MAYHHTQSGLPSPICSRGPESIAPRFQSYIADGVHSVGYAGRPHPPLGAANTTRSYPSLGLYTPPEEMATGVALQASFPWKHSGNFGEFPCRPQSNQTHIPNNTNITTKNVDVQNDTRKQEPPSLTNHLPESEDEEGSSSAIASFLQIPSSINNSKGSLAEFAAEIACLFWFQSTSKLELIEDGLPQHVPVPPADPESVPSIGFRKWATTMLATTQVSQNVILLALLFIYRLKNLNPRVKGRSGSEFRLLTVALMMGNKFLDDNTYTNKTWAEVSGISVQEIHVMEVEFLSNIRYNLLVTKEEWNKWHGKLGVFSHYLERAPRDSRYNNARAVTNATLRPSPCLTPVSANGDFPYRAHPPKLPALPVADYAARYQPAFQAMAQLGVPSPACSEPVEPLGVGRKRSHDDNMETHPAKRVATGNVAQANSFAHSPANPVTWSYPIPATTHESASQIAAPVARVPNPRVHFDVTPTTDGLGPDSSLPSQHSLSTRVQTGVYPPTTLWNQPTFPTTTLAPLPPHRHNTSSGPSGINREAPHLPCPATVSPHRPGAYPTHTPIHLSPSVFLDRNSPYRPVRRVHTLLYSPPSTSLRQPRKLSVDQIHYQPLSKATTEQRRGILPCYQPEPWTYTSAQQLNYPDFQQYRMQG